ncbi:hypothetical protein OPV22_003102 [Ensete ventricosum]|uniref:Uncharacterized protein n=1 Tax=Ensete ventricosum TaxID=4639 RepID=A0AAV8RZU8_ENSVE|nr:hypothetical protein OPV22_003102 [Ensete ventricosum]
MTALELTCISRRSIRRFRSSLDHIGFGPLMRHIDLIHRLLDQSVYSRAPANAHPGILITDNSSLPCQNFVYCSLGDKDEDVLTKCSVDETSPFCWNCLPLLLESFTDCNFLGGHPPPPVVLSAQVIDRLAGRGDGSCGNTLRGEPDRNLGSAALSCPLVHQPSYSRRSERASTQELY